MRIALCPSAYAPDVGGVEEHVRNLVIELCRLGHDVEVWAPAAAGRSAAETIESVAVLRLATPLPAGRLGPAARFVGSFWPALMSWRRNVTRFRPDVIHVHCFGPNGIYASLAARAGGIPLVVSLHGETFMDDHDIFGRSVVMRTGLRAALRSAAEVTGCSEVTLQDARARFALPASRGVVVFNGVDLGETTAEVSPSSRPLTGRRYILGIGRMVPNKGFDLLLEAFALLASELPDIDLTIGGSGSALSPLTERASDLGLAERVHLPGRMNRTQVLQAMQNAAVFVMPSRIEPFGIVVLEAWRSGAPLVCSRNGGPREFVTEGVDGLLIDPEDGPALSAAVRRVLTEPGLGDRLANAGLRRVIDFSWPDVATRYVKLYSAAVASD